MLVALVSLLLACVLWTTLSSGRQSSRDFLKNVAGPKKEHWFTGNLHRLFRDGWKYNFDLFTRYGGLVKVYGVLGAEQLLVSDPKALHYILVKEPDVYHETDMFVMSNKLVLGEGVIATLGDQHKKHRKMLNPAFSLPNLRKLLPSIQPTVDRLADLMRAELPADGGVREVDVVPWMARGTLEYVSGGVLGASLETLDRSKQNPHGDAIREVNHTALNIYYLRPFVPFVMRNLSRYWRNKIVDWLPIAGLRALRDISYVLDKSARDIVLRKKAEMVQDNAIGVTRDDLMSVMLKANIPTSEEERLTDDELAGQINTLLLAGQEPLTTALARTLYMLARDHAAQKRLRSEIRQAKQAHAAADPGDWRRTSLPYDALTSLPYLDAVVRETFRLYPPTNMLNRTCTQDAVLPLQFPVRSTTGEEVRAVRVPAGTNIIMSILGANHERRVWGEDASEWRPERWLGARGERLGVGKDGSGVDLAFGQDRAEQDLPTDVPGSRNGVRYPGVYGSMMTFLAGGRACIGFKFAEMEIKQVLSTLLCEMHFDLPSAVDAESGARKEIYWRMDVLQVPVVRPPHGDGKTSQAPLDVRLVRETDFV